MISSDYELLRVGDVVDFQLRSSLDDAAPHILGTIIEIGETITRAPYFMTNDGFYLLTSLRTIRVLS